MSAPTDQTLLNFIPFAIPNSVHKQWLNGVGSFSSSHGYLSYDIKYK